MRARASAPCVIFFDELDALVPRRDDALSESSARVVNTLLTELDGLDARRAVYVIAATNRPDMIDPAMCRPGRLDKLLYVDLPSAEERAEIVRTLVRRVPLAGEQTRVAVEAVVREHGEGYSGADLAAVVREAGVVALRRTLGALDQMEQTRAPGEGESSAEETRIVVGVQDFERALQKVQPSVSTAQRRKYTSLRVKLSGSGMPVGVKADEGKEGEKHSTGGDVQEN